MSQLDIFAEMQHDDVEKMKASIVIDEEIERHHAAYLGQTFSVIFYELHQKFGQRYIDYLQSLYDQLSKIVEPKNMAYDEYQVPFPAILKVKRGNVFCIAYGNTMNNPIYAFSEIPNEWWYRIHDH